MCVLGLFSRKNDKYKYELEAFQLQENGNNMWLCVRVWDNI